LILKFIEKARQNMDDPWDKEGRLTETGKDFNDNFNWTTALERANGGDADSQYQMSQWHFNGKNKFVEIDSAKGREWLRKAAENGNAQAQYRMGLDSTCTSEQYYCAKAFEWYQKAAEQGHSFACYKIGKYYATGNVVEQDLDKAAEWYKKAADKGMDMAATLLERIKNGDTDTSTFAERMT
jgi:TPR repeat protein